MGLPGARETFPATGRACPAAQWLLNFGRMCFASLIFAFSGLRLVCHGIESGRAPPHQRLWRARHIARIFAPELVPLANPQLCRRCHARARLATRGLAGHPQHPPHHRGQIARLAAAAAGAGPQVTLRFHDRAWRAVQHGPGRRPGWASRPTPTCFGMPMGMRWPTRGTTRGRYSPTSATEPSSTRCGTPSCRRPVSRISGVTKDCFAVLELKRTNTAAS